MSNNRSSFRFHVVLIALFSVSVVALTTDWYPVRGLFGSPGINAQEIESVDSPSSPSALAYTRSIFTSVYSPISTGGGATQLNGGSGTGDFSSSGGTPDVNDGTAYIPLPFIFTYNGTAMTPASNFLGICTNGFAYFSSVNTNLSKDVGSNNFNLFQNTGANSTLAPYWDQLIANTAVNGITGSVLYQTTGAAPNRVLTVQWGNYPSFSGSFGRAINFQVKIYEGTNLIEFHYGPVSEGTILGGNINESASIGIENATGGNNNYLDALTGSSQTNHGMLTSSRFPKFNFRFTPGAPSAIPGGTYNVGAGQTYPSLSEAIAEMNHRGITGPVTLNLTDTNYDYSTPNGSNLFPILLGPIAGNSSTNTITIEKSSGVATLTAGGAGASGNIGNQILATGITGSNEPIFGLVGADYVTMRNLNFTVTPGTLTVPSGSNVDHGLLVLNSSQTDGATNNVFRDLSFSLDRANSNSLAIFQFASVLNNSAGANSSNKYYNLTIANSFAGIWLDGVGSFPDTGNEIGGTGAANKNTIGGATANDIGNGGNQTWGIRVRNQSGVKIVNNEIRNITGTGSLPVDGILVDQVGSVTLGVGANEISSNVVHDLNATLITAGVVSGIRENLPNNAASSSNVFNNFIYNLNSSSTVNTSRRIIGISSQSDGLGVAPTHNIYNNSVRLSPANLATSNSAFEVGTTSHIFNVRNNIFANFTGAQTGGAMHYSWVSTTATSIGGAGSVSDFNDLYIDNTTNGFVGRGATTNFATLADWRTMMSGPGPDDNSISSNPLFASSTNLHLTLLSPTIDTGTTIASLLVDIDGHTRPHGAAIYDIGADEAIPEMDVKGLTISIPDDDVTPSLTDDTDFDSTPVIGGSVTHVFTIQNTGLAILNLAGTPKVVVGGANAAEFAVTVQPSTPVAAGSGTTTFTVVFDPVAGGLRSATLSIANDDTNESPYNFAIQGIGLTPEMDVKGLNTSIPDGDLTPSVADDTDFGSANINGVTVTHVFTIENTGNLGLNLNGNPRVAVGGPNAADFTVTIQPSSSIAPGGTTTFTVVFDPGVVGSSSATLSVANDDLDENPYDFSIQGTGVMPPAFASLTGRVTTPSGLGLRNAVVALTDPQGVRRTATTSSFGIYSFADVATGQTYVVGVSSKRYRFAAQSVLVNGNLTVDFVGLE